MQMVKQSSTPPADLNHITVETRQTDAATLAAAIAATPAQRPGGAAPIRFAVTYTLRDYLAVLNEHARCESARGRGRKTASPLARLTLPLWVALVGTPLYLVKRYQLGPCEFMIDGVGVTRVSKRGALHKPWSELKDSHAYSGSYLLAFARGALPIPYRCLSATQGVQMRAWLAAHG